MNSSKLIALVGVGSVALGFVLTACGRPPLGEDGEGSAGSGGGGATEGAAGAGGDGYSSGPRLLSSDPADGAVGVAERPDLVLTFDEPMDKQSVIDALVLRRDGERLEELDYSWDKEGLVLTVLLPSGTIAYKDVAPGAPGFEYRLNISTVARSLKGEYLDETAIAFHAKRRVQEALPFVQAGYITKTNAGPTYVRKSGVRCGAHDEVDVLKGYFSFDLSEIPAQAALESAQMAITMTDYVCKSTPATNCGFGSLGSVTLARGAFALASDATSDQMMALFDLAAQETYPTISSQGTHDGTAVTQTYERDMLLDVQELLADASSGTVLGFRSSCGGDSGSTYGHISFAGTLNLVYVTE